MSSVCSAGSSIKVPEAAHEHLYGLQSHWEEQMTIIGVINENIHTMIEIKKRGVVNSLQLSSTGGNTVFFF